jgi:single-stranded-DNA-specific exonuclease
MPLPSAIAILNPATGRQYPYKELCCGVGFKLITALAQRYSIDETFIFATSIFLQQPLRPHCTNNRRNRILAYHGLQQINNNPSAGIQALIKLVEFSS